MIIGQCIAEGVDRTVQVAHPVGDVEEMRVDARIAVVLACTEAVDETEDVEWSPTDEKRAENQRDGPQSLPGAILCPGLPPTASGAPVARSRAAESAEAPLPRLGAFVGEPRTAPAPLVTVINIA